MKPLLDAWTQEPPLVDESEFTPWAEQGWSSWNMWSAEKEFCEFAAELVLLLRPRYVIETGTGQGFLTRRVDQALAYIVFRGTSICFEADDEWREGLFEKFADLSYSILSGKKIPNKTHIASADLLFLDSHWPERIQEINLWLLHGKPGSFALIHDVSPSHPPNTGHHRLAQVLKASGIPGWFFDNPRGSFLAYMPEGFESQIDIRFSDESPNSQVELEGVDPNPVLIPESRGSKSKGLVNVEGKGQVEGEFREEVEGEFLEDVPLPKVAVAWLYPGDVRGEFATSLLHTTLHSRELIHTTIIRQSGPMIQAGRNWVVETFLDRSDADWLWMVDTDMVWDPEALEQLLTVADPETHPIVGGLCFLRGADGVVQATIYKFIDETFTRAENIPVDEVVEVDATGAAFLLIHRSVLEQMREKYPLPYPWFSFTQLGDKAVGEDITFCMRARDLGHKIYVDTKIKVGHVKDIMLDLDYYHEWRSTHHYLITGVGRSGTRYLATLLTRMGIVTGHEMVFGPFGKEDLADHWGGLRGDSSWMAAPYTRDLRLTGTRIVHLVRDPIAVIRSHLALEFFSEGEGKGPVSARPYLKFMAEHTPQIMDISDPLLRAMDHYVTWNELVEPNAHHRVRVEDLTDPSILGDVLTTIRTPRTLADMQQVYEVVPTDVNTASSLEYPDLSWDSLPDGPIKLRLLAMAERYGYR